MRRCSTITALILPATTIRQAPGISRPLKRRCRDIHSLGNDYYGYVTGTRIEWVYTAGIQGIVSWEGGKFKSNLSDPALIEGFRMQAQLVKEGLIKDDWDANLFINGRTGMINTTNYGFGKKRAFSKVSSLKWQLFRLPNPEGKKYDTVYGLGMPLAYPRGLKTLKVPVFPALLFGSCAGWHG